MPDTLHNLSNGKDPCGGCEYDSEQVEGITHSLDGIKDAIAGQYRETTMLLIKALIAIAVGNKALDFVMNFFEHPHSAVSQTEKE